MTNECRHCKTELTLKFLDLGHAPPSNAYLTVEDLSRPEITFPLRLWVCSSCRLVQTEDFADADQLFTEDYAYFSSTSKSWLAHAAEYVDMIVDRLSLTSDSHVIEVASNDGYLLKNFLERDIPCLGVEPTKSTAEAAEALGIPVLQEFFGEEMAKELPRADLILGNNVYAHVPDINDFTLGLTESLKPQGVVTLEFPHLMRLVEFNQFDTVYHEHFSYLSLLSVTKIMASAGLRVFDVEELPTHGDRIILIGLLGEQQVAVIMGITAERQLIRVTTIVDQLGGVLVPVAGLADEVEGNVHQCHLLLKRRGLAAQFAQALAQDHVGIRQAQQVFL